jgi:hypothetical protein
MPTRSAGNYNSLELMPLLSYNIITYLIENNETIWKLLKYNSSDAWNKNNLSQSEKRALVYSNQSNIEDYRVFMDSGQDNAWQSKICILRVPVLEVYPTNRIVANVTIGFEVYCHSEIYTMSNYQTRVDVIVKELISTLNEVEVGGLGKLFFDYSANSRCKIVTIGKIPFRGKGVVMANWIT